MAYSEATAPRASRRWLSQNAAAISAPASTNALPRRKAATTPSTSIRCRCRASSRSSTPRSSMRVPMRPRRASCMLAAIADREADDDARRSRKADRRPWILVHVGVGIPSRDRGPVERFALELAKAGLGRIQVGFHGVAHRARLVAAHVREGTKQRLRIGDDLAEILEKPRLGRGEFRFLLHWVSFGACVMLFGSGKVTLSSMPSIS